MSTFPKTKRTSQVGDSIEADRVVFMVDKELGALASCVSNFDHDERRKRLAALQEKNSASVIQRKWRKKHRDAPSIPASMRALLSVCFEPQIKILPPEAPKVSVAGQITNLQETGTDQDSVTSPAVGAVAPSGGSVEQAVAAMGGTPLIESVQVVKRAPRFVVRPVEWVLLWLDDVYR
jgi:hypothetical protein